MLQKFILSPVALLSDLIQQIRMYNISMKLRNTNFKNYFYCGIYGLVWVKPSDEKEEKVQK